LPNPRGAALCLAALAAGCLPHGLKRKDTPPGPNGVVVRFLGVGGFLIKKGPDVIMTAPHYSCPPIDALLGDSLGDGSAAPARYFREHHIAEDASAVKAVLVGHAHYDHLMDVPFFLDRAPLATVFGSTSARNVLAGYGPPYAQRTVALNEAGNDRVDSRNCAGPIPGDDCASWSGGSGEWVPVPNTGGRVRIRAFCSAHPPQVFATVHFWPGCVTSPLRAAPTHPSELREGEVLAFLIDFLDDQVRPVFRVYYQDAPVQDPVGWVPADVLSDRDVDVALLCVGTFEAVRKPEEVASRNLHARAVVLHHWEDFFDPDHRSLAAIPGTDVNSFRTAVIREMGGKASRVRLLAPGVATGF
jgi:L-ascorbate metabolism protein UlaG (beta-lactamase superfamily)